MGQGRPQKAADGSLTFPQRGFEPPPVPAGYLRKTTNLKSPDAWCFIPILKPCEHRTMEVEKGPGSCEAVSIKYFCKGIRRHDLSACERCEL